MKEFPTCFSFSVSHTSRQMRNGEEEGKNYYYVTREYFLDMIEKNELVEYNVFNKNYYGTSKKELAKLAEGKKVYIKLYFLL